MKESFKELVQKYDWAGPRYTSYPPAPVFSKFGSDDFLGVMNESPDETSDVSLYFHIPFCNTLCYFCGCTTLITRNHSRIDEYLTYLKREIALLAPLISKKRKVVQVHWGGGTPTYLSPSQIVDLGTTIRNSFTIDNDAEVGVEIDPRDLSYHHLRALREVGFNRISLGVQDFDPRVQYAVNRNQSEFITRRAIDWSRALGFSSINLDMIYGLPVQTVATFRESIRKVVAISPDRIAVYNFAFVPWMKKHQSLIHPEDLPSPETKIEILSTTVDELSRAGYVYLGMDHFAKPDNEIALAQRNGTLRRNFQGYSTRAGSDLYGLGMSAISHFGTSYAQNAKTLPEYYDAIDHGRFATERGYRMTADDQVRKHIIMKLMCDLKLDVAGVERKFGITFEAYFSDSLRKLEPLIADGFLSVSGNSLDVSETGRFFLRNIAMCFDAYLPARNLRQPMYSQTV